MSGKIPAGVGPKYPQILVLVGATGDLSRRKLLPGLFHLVTAGFIPGCRIIGASLDDIDTAAFRSLARDALREFSTRPVPDTAWEAFAANLEYVPISAGAASLRAAVERAEKAFGTETRRVHYLSVPPAAALSAVKQIVSARRDGIVVPLGAGLPGRYRRWDWLASAWAEEHVVGPVSLLVVEGVGSGALEYADAIGTLVWVSAPAEVRLARGLERDGEAMLGHWEQWMVDEAAHFAAQRTRERADVVLDAADGWRLVEG
mgnify:CR=1 FL=1